MSSVYLIRLDDASDYMDVEKWYKVEAILDKHSLKPLVGIIPKNEDPAFVERYEEDTLFWEKAQSWVSKGWSIALHGYNHVYITKDAGINPINERSEFAGVSLETQEFKISEGLKILHEKKIFPKYFFAPSHSFDSNTLKALKTQSDIRIISDTIANNVYKEGDFYFIPQQFGKVRRAPFKIVTICLHPNEMTTIEFDKLDDFIKKYRKSFVSFDDVVLSQRKLSWYDKTIRNLYFLARKLLKLVRG